MIINKDWQSIINQKVRYLTKINRKELVLVDK